MIPLPTHRRTSTSRLILVIRPSHHALFLLHGQSVQFPMTQVDDWKRFVVRRILNIAEECDDNNGLQLREALEEYHKIPMRGYG